QPRGSFCPSSNDPLIKKAFVCAPEVEPASAAKTNSTPLMNTRYRWSMFNTRRADKTRPFSFGLNLKPKPDAKHLLSWYRVPWRRLARTVFRIYQRVVRSFRVRQAFLPDIRRRVSAWKG